MVCGGGGGGCCSDCYDFCVVVVFCLFGLVLIKKKRKE